MASTPPASLSKVVERLIRTLEPSGETYAFGGAIALAAWSEPRATADIDVVVWMDPDRIDDTIALVQSAGVEVDPPSARADAALRGMFVGRASGIRVDVFVPSIPFYEEAERRRVRTEIAGLPTWVHSAEVLAVFKMLYFRPKDLLDIERMHRSGARPSTGRSSGMRFRRCWATTSAWRGGTPSAPGSNRSDAALRGRGGGCRARRASWSRSAPRGR